jgi:hypothetical protein
MKQTIFIKNTPIDEKRISFIEKVVTRLTRRNRNQTSVLMTPYPISNCVTGDTVTGTILKYMFCANGKISKLMLYLGKKPKNGAELSILIESDLSSKKESFITMSKGFEIDFNTEIKSGDRLTISIKTLGEKDPITEAWISFLWVPNVKEAKVKAFLIDELERTSVEFLEEYLIEE